jgi:hypothetical protein
LESREGMVMVSVAVCGDHVVASVSSLLFQRLRSRLTKAAQR